MLPNNIFSLVIPLFRKKYVELSQKKRLPTTVKAAANRARGLLDGLSSESSLKDRQSALESAAELVIYAMCIFHFWGVPAKELQKYGKQTGRRDRLGDKG